MWGFKQKVELAHLPAKRSKLGRRSTVNVGDRGLVAWISLVAEANSRYGPSEDDGPSEDAAAVEPDPAVVPFCRDSNAAHTERAHGNLRGQIRRLRNMQQELEMEAVRDGRSLRDVERAGVRRPAFIGGIRCTPALTGTNPAR